LEKTMLDNTRVRLSTWAPLFLRIALGVGFMAVGWGKMEKVMDGRMPVGEVVGTEFIDKALNWSLAVTEFGGGACLILGLLTRFWSLGMVIAMIVAITWRHWDQTSAGLESFFEGVVGGLSGDRGDLRVGMAGAISVGFQTGWLFLLMALAVFCTGPGAISIDYLFGLIVRGRRANAVVGAGLKYPARDAKVARAAVDAYLSQSQPAPQQTARPQQPPQPMA
jgi:putative oxidoreductase